MLGLHPLADLPLGVLDDDSAFILDPTPVYEMLTSSDVELIVMARIEIWQPAGTVGV